MKVGILTFHRAENFGAALQVYALQNILTTLGHDAEIIDYRCPKVELMYHIYNPSIIWSKRNVIKSLQEFFHRFENLKERKRKKKQYSDFRRDYLNISPKVKNGNVGHYDAFVVGSDQVWNFGIIGGYNPMYFLDFPSSVYAKRVSYAASSEANTYGRIIRNEFGIKKAFESFDCLSVREAELAEAINKISDKAVEVNIDPTFLLSQSHYKQIARFPQRNRKYILVYHLFESPLGTELANRVAIKKGLDVVEVHAKFVSDNNPNQLCDLGPLELLGYIINAELVFTTSFHGLALSLINHKDVWVINKGHNSRQRNLLKLMGVSQRIISELDDYDSTSVIDFASVDCAIQSQKKKALNYLTNALK